MLKVFLVDDESIIRKGLRDNIPWRQYGYEFIGEASDGEMALPMIRKLQPDVLITDIKMPFMDGLALSQMITQEFPDMKIIIISGYDEFEYAQQAIRVGVEQYLLKPITRNALQKVLQEIREKIETEREQKNYLDKVQEEMQEYEQYSKKRFLEKVFEGRLSVQEIYEEAGKLSLDLGGPCYNLALLNLQEAKARTVSEAAEAEKIDEELLRYFMRFSEYMIFRWSINVYIFLIKGEKEEMRERVDRCVENIRRICAEREELLDWHIAVGETVERLSQLPACYTKANHRLAHRFLMPGQHILTDSEIAAFAAEADAGNAARTDGTKGGWKESDREGDNQSRYIMRKAVSYIEENFSQEDFSLNMAAAAIGVSANYFSGIFSQEMNQTFIEYVTQKRMEKAKKLLRQTKMHSGEIAAAVGYKDSHYFSSVFKKTQGCTPREYRNGK